MMEDVEDSTRSGIILESINKNFITLIPKTEKPSSFNEYRPVALRNLFYKLISKIIANRLKVVMSKDVSAEKFGFFLIWMLWALSKKSCIRSR